MAYTVKEIFYSLQGEGNRTGRPAVFCRFTGCNLWSGREADREKSVCRFCDTDFVGTSGPLGGRYPTAEALANQIATLWPEGYPESRYVVFTGGEPLLQLDVALIDVMHQIGFEVAIETNGTLPVPPGVDWVCVSPKMGAKLVVTEGDELKVIVPQEGQDLGAYEQLAFSHYYLQPMAGGNAKQNLKIAIDTCLKRPKWKLSLQTHKYLQIP
ncbi:MAG: 7-carboxy-7-deazaguanine synthase [Oxalobacter sp.]|nr:7-carboxy-7-deazaguanine synthase [Oxalobacter sp.]MBR5999957.1 7-carboxy-7-deazaguanine synthase [Oxalobacter sp.]